MERAVISAISNGSSTQDITHSGSWQPKAAIIQWNRGSTSQNAFTEHMSFGYGITDGTNQRCVCVASEDNQARGDTSTIQSNNSLITALSPTGTVTAVDAVATFNSWLSNGIRINWTDQPAANFYFTVILIGGDDITNVLVNTLMTGTGTGNVSYSSTSWEGDYGIFMTGGIATENSGVSNAFISFGMATGTSGSVNQWMQSLYNLDNPVSMTTQQYYSHQKVVVVHGTSSVDGYATFSGFNATGFTINIPDAFSASIPIYFLIIKGGAFSVGNATEIGSVTTQEITVNKDVKLVGIFGIDYGTPDAITTNCMWTSGWGDGTSQNVNCFEDKNASADSVVVSRHDTDQIYLNITGNATASSSTLDDEAALSAIGSASYTLNWTNIGQARPFRYCTMGTGLISVTKTVTAKFDVYQEVSKSVTVKHDIYQEIPKSVTVKYDIYQDVVKQATILFDVYQEVTKTFTTIFDILQNLIDVTKTFTVKYDIYQDVEKQVTTKFDVYEEVIKSATIKFDIIQDVIKKFKAVFDIIPTKANYIPLTGNAEGVYYIGYASYLVNVIKTITAKFDILEEVTKDATVKFDVYQDIEKDATVKFDIMQEITKAVTIQFDILQEVVKQFTVLHDIYEEVSKSVTTKYDIYQDVSKSVTVKFDILQEILKQFTVIFDILEQGLVDVTKTFTTIFNINQEVSKSVITKFDILQDILKTVTIKHDIYQEVSKSVITKFDILQEITKSATVKFDIIQEVTKQFTVIFDILELGLVNVTKTFTTIFDIVQEVQKSATTKFDIYQEIEKDATIKFDIYEEVSKSVAIKFDIIQEVIKTNTMLFDILQQVEVSKTVKFDIYQTIEKDFTTIFDILQEIEKQFTVIFNIESEIPVFDVEKIFTTKFNIYEDVEKSVTTKFDIIQDIIKRFRIKFNIKGKHHIDSDHAVMDNKQKDQFSKSDFTWNLTDHRSKIRWSKKKGWFIDKA